MALFDIPQRAGVAQDLAVAKKANSKAKKTTTTVRSTGIAGRIQQIKFNVDTKLGQYRDKYQVIMDKDILHDFITECIGNGYISIDTETDGLNPLQNHLAGICPYTYGQKGSYIPLNHISYLSDERVDGQLPIDFVMGEFKRLLEKKPEIDMFNATFDIKFLRRSGLNDIYCTWDGYLGARLLNENEPVNKLKPLWLKYCQNGVGDAFTFDSLFEGIPFTKVPIQIGYVYAANDPVITTELCDFQRQHLRADSDREDMRELYWVFKNIEMPVVDVVADMELTGVDFDLAYNQQLAKKYSALVTEKLQAVEKLCEPYEQQLIAYKSLHPNVKLDIPINIGSPSQLSILLYEIIKLDAGYDNRTQKKITGTGEDILSRLDHPICKAILEYREMDKLMSTYITKLPTCVDPADNRIHCRFNQYGADTGRFSSSDPNLQNIPSHNKDIRKMFRATPGYALMSSDFSQQEPKCLAAICRKYGDSQMYETFMQGKDLYSEIASVSFHKSYEECREFNPDGSTNPEGKARRSQAKSILLGVLYGRGIASIAEQLHCSEEEAQSIKDSVFRGFPAIKKFEEDSLAMAREVGYVTTVCGRKRRLPNLQLPEYEFRWLPGHSNPYDDPLDFTTVGDTDVPDDICEYYWNKLIRSKFKDRQKIYEEANRQGINVINNGAKIAESTRQCVNARIQGSAADLTKLAMIELHQNPRLKELGFRMLIPVHDEIIAECPIENLTECSKLLAETMSLAAEKILEMPIKCDVECTYAWYGEKIEV